jgi:hypothetical protein
LYQEDKDDNITEVTGVIAGKGSPNLDKQRRLPKRSVSEPGKHGAVFTTQLRVGGMMWEQI